MLITTEQKLDAIKAINQSIESSEKMLSALERFKQAALLNDLQFQLNTSNQTGTITLNDVDSIRVLDIMSQRYANERNELFEKAKILMK